MNEIILRSKDLFQTDYSFKLKIRAFTSDSNDNTLHLIADNGYSILSLYIITELSYDRESNNIESYKKFLSDNLLEDNNFNIIIGYKDTNNEYEKFNTIINTDLLEFYSKDIKDDNLIKIKKVNIIEDKDFSDKVNRGDNIDFLIKKFSVKDETINDIEIYSRKVNIIKESDIDRNDKNLFIATGINNDGTENIESFDRELLLTSNIPNSKLSDNTRFLVKTTNKGNLDDYTSFNTYSNDSVSLPLSINHDSEIQVYEVNNGEVNLASEPLWSTMALSDEFIDFNSLTVKLNCPLNSSIFMVKEETNGILIDKPIYPSVDVTNCGLYNRIYCYYSLDGGSWNSMEAKEFAVVNPEYLTTTDSNGISHIVKDENGDPVVITPGVYNYFYTSPTGISDIGSHNIRFMYVDKNYDYNTFTTSNIGFQLIDFFDCSGVIIVAPDTETNDDDSDTPTIPTSFTELEDNQVFTTGIYIDYRDNAARFDYAVLKIDGKSFPRVYNYSVNGRHEATLETFNSRYGISKIVRKAFTISNERPPVVEIEGIEDNADGETFDVLVKTEIGANIEIWYYNVANPNNKIIPSIARTTKDDIEYLKFTLDDNGTFNLVVRVTCLSNGVYDDTIIKNITIDSGSVTDKGKLIRFIQPGPPVHSTRMELRTNKKNSKLSYWLKKKPKGVKGTRYLAPILIFENLVGYGREVNNTKSVNARRKFNGILDYTPELPVIKGIEEDTTYYKLPIRFTFENVATYKNRAMYYIFLDGALLNNPFNSTFEVSHYGTHFITIIAWDNVRPIGYNFYHFKFMVRSELKANIRKPTIVTDQNPGDEKVNITVNFTKVHESVINTIKIQYPDGTIEEKIYPWDVGTVTITVYKNCIVTASTKFAHDEDSDKSDTVVIDSIFDTKTDLTDLNILGLKDYTISVTNGPSDIVKDFNIKIGPCAILDFGKKWNYLYDLYVNGEPYKTYSEMIKTDLMDNGDNYYNPDQDFFPPIIENQCHELRKYRLELVAKNRWQPENENLMSYYYTEFLIDSLDLPFPKLSNINENIMTRSMLPKVITTKEEPEGVYTKGVFNDEALPINSTCRLVILKDDECLLTITYTFYDGRKRTSTFCFSINSNVIDELTPNRVILKVKDFQDIPDYDYYVSNGIEPKPHEGEFIIDRRTGHLYFGGKEGTIVTEIHAITKDMEMVLADAEGYLLMIERSYTKLKQFVETCLQMLEYYLKKLEDFLKRLEYYKKLLDETCERIDKLRSDLDKLIEDIRSFEASIKNQTDYIAGDIKERTEDLIAVCKELNEDFIRTVDDLNKNVFTEGAKVNDDVYRQRKAIKRKVTIDEFKAFKERENKKFNKFKKKAKKYGKVVSSI